MWITTKTYWNDPKVSVPANINNVVVILDKEYSLEPRERIGYYTNKKWFVYMNSDHEIEMDVEYILWWMPIPDYPNELE